MKGYEFKPGVKQFFRVARLIFSIGVLSVLLGLAIVFFYDLDKKVENIKPGVEIREVVVTATPTASPSVSPVRRATNSAN